MNATGKSLPKAKLIKIKSSLHCPDLTPYRAEMKSIMVHLILSST